MSTGIDELVRIEGGRVLATLIRLTGDFGIAEDALQDALLTALERWPAGEPPANPAGWLLTVARNKALDRLRREARRQAKESEAMRLLVSEPDEPSDGTDDRLRLIFTCCHPALSPEARVALALRTVCGLTTTEIARAFLVPEPTIGQRISRAKRKIATSRIPYRVPADHELPERLESVLAAIYLVFTTGHHAPQGRLDSRLDLAEEALRLSRLLFELMPDEPQVRGLLALILATHARRRTRLDDEGNLALLEQQDRSRWDRAAIEEAAGLVESTLRSGARSPYLVQAAIACLHGLAPSFEETDWPQIAVLYRLLEQLLPTAVVRVNRAVAEAMAGGPEAGLALLDGLKDAEAWHLYWTTRAELLWRLGSTAEAIDSYRRALDCDMNDSDRRLVEMRLVELTDGADS